MCDGKGICTAQHCEDGVQDADETDMDCGGSCAAGGIDGSVGGKCAWKRRCLLASDCASGGCEADFGSGADAGNSMDGGDGIDAASDLDAGSGISVCLAPTCSDGVQNGDETGVDCGGVCGQTDINSCGQCGHVCLQGAHVDSAGCSTGICQGTCERGWTDCDRDPSNGCEIDLIDDPVNCGACNTTCPSNSNMTATCQAGHCNGLCDAGRDNCDNSKSDNGCNVNLVTDPNNCGRCGNACGDGFGCEGGSCSATSTMFGNLGGGSAFGPDLCPSGEAMIGIAGNHAGNIDGFQAICGRLSVSGETSPVQGLTVSVVQDLTLPWHGINSTNPFSIACPTDQALVGIGGYFDTTDLSSQGLPTAGVHQLTIYCSPLTVPGQTRPPVSAQVSNFTILAASPPTLAGSVDSTYNLSQSTAFSFTCPSSSIMVGSAGRSGNWIDALQFVCQIPVVP